MNTSMKCRKARMEGGIMPIKSLQARWRSETFQTQYPMWNCSWLLSKWKVISVMDTNMKYKKAGMEEGIMPIKSLWAGWRRDTFQTQYPMCNCSWMHWKLKKNFCNGPQYEMQKSQDGEGNNAYKIFTSQMEERNITCKHKSCLELFIATMKKKQFSELSKK